MSSAQKVMAVYLWKMWQLCRKNSYSQFKMLILAPLYLNNQVPKRKSKRTILYKQGVGYGGSELEDFNETSRIGLMFESKK